MKKYFAIQKFDERSGCVYGIMTAAEPDKSGEIFDYAGGGKEAVQRWSAEAARSTTAAGLEVSRGNIRLQHDSGKIAGKAVRIDYDDSAQTIGLLSKPVNEEIAELIRGGFVRGYSIAGGYDARRCDECGADMLGRRDNFCARCNRDVYVRYVPRLAEVSYVDNPCLESAVFAYVKADGTTELRKFAKGENMKEHLDNLRRQARKVADQHRAVADGHTELARAAEGRAEPKAAKAHRSIAESHREIAKAHEEHADTLRGMATAGDDLGADKSVTADFFDRLYGSGNFSKAAQRERTLSPTGGLFD